MFASLGLDIDSHVLCSWEAILIELDRKPFSDLARIVQSLEDDRIWTLAEWVGEEFAPKAPDGTWYPHYHKLLYDLTDEAVRACSPFTRYESFPVIALTHAVHQ